MSELKAYIALISELNPAPCQTVYLKSEADKVIAELEMKLATAQLAQRLNEPEALYSNLDTMNRLSNERNVVARRERYQKYKRCLAMARWCEEVDLFGGYTSNYWMRWRNKWMELAEKFKPNN